MTLFMNISTQELISSLPDSIGECKYTWIDFWNNLIEFSNCNVQKGKHIYRFKTHEDSFSGNNIVDTVFLYLYTCKNEFINDITREKATKLCQLMLNCKILHAVNGKSEKFEDMNNKIYKFNTKHDIFINLNPSEDNLKFRKTSKNIRRSLNNLSNATSLSKYEDDLTSEEFTIRSDMDSQFNDEEGTLLTNLPEGGKASWRRRSSLILGSIGNKYEKYWHHSTPIPKHRPYVSQKDNNENIFQSIYDDDTELNRCAIKENALSELTKLLEIPLLDGILQESIQFPNEYRTHISKYFQFFEDECKDCSDDTWIKGLTCLKFINNEDSLEIYKLIISSECNSELRKINLYTRLHDVYTQQKSVLWPNVYIDVHLGLLRQLCQGPLSTTLHAFKLALILLDSARLWQLVALLEFLKAIMLDSNIQLSNVESNRSVIIKTFSSIILQNKSMSAKDTGTFVAFLIDYSQHFIFKKGFKPIFHAPSCIRITQDKYEGEKIHNTNCALVEMMQKILNDDKIPVKDKKCRLTDFQKFHRHLFNLYFRDFKF